jgi:phage baseplate assembly protein V
VRHLLNQQRACAQQATQTNQPVRVGTVVDYNPNEYCVKVVLEPFTGSQTEWIPLLSPMVGNGWGMFCPPSVGDQIAVLFQDGIITSAMAGLRFFSDQDRPLPCPSGEFWLVHQSGAGIKLTNDGKITATDPSGTVWQLSNDGAVRVTGNLFVSGNVEIGGNNLTKGNTTTNGSTLSRGAITGQGGMAVSGGTGANVTGNMNITSGTVTADGIDLKAHTHRDSHGGNTGPAQ